MNDYQQIDLLQTSRTNKQILGCKEICYSPYLDIRGVSAILIINTHKNICSIQLITFLVNVAGFMECSITHSLLMIFNHMSRYSILSNKHARMFVDLCFKLRNSVAFFCGHKKH